MSGPTRARRGDRIRCTVLFQEKRDADGKIPVFFTLNGSDIILQRGESPESSLIFMDFKEPLFPFIGMTEGSSVLAKVRTLFNLPLMFIYYSSGIEPLMQEFLTHRLKFELLNPQKIIHL